MVTVIARYVIRKGSEKEVESLISEMARNTRQEPGNRAYDVYRQMGDPGKILLHEIYESQAALDAHRAAPYFKTLVLDQLVHLLESRVVDVFEKEA